MPILHFIFQLIEVISFAIFTTILLIKDKSTSRIRHSYPFIFSNFYNTLLNGILFVFIIFYHQNSGFRENRMMVLR